MHYKRGARFGGRPFSIEQRPTCTRYTAMKKGLFYGVALPAGLAATALYIGAPFYMEDM